MNPIAEDNIHPTYWTWRSQASTYMKQSPLYAGLLDVGR